MSGCDKKADKTGAPPSSGSAGASMAAPATSASSAVAASVSASASQVPTPAVVAKDQNRPVAVIIAGGYIFWANHGVDAAGKEKPGLGSLQKVPVGGGDAVSVATKLDLPTSVAADATHVYWTETTAVKRAPLGGGPASVVIRVGEGKGIPTALAVDPEFALIGLMHMTNGGVFKARKGGGPLLEVNGGLLMADAVATDGGSTFACINGDVLGKIPKGGSAGDASVLAKGLKGCAGVAADQNAVFYAESKAGTLNRVTKTGGEPTVLARDLGEPHEVVVDGEYVYWLERQSGRVARVPTKGGPVTVVASDLKAPRGLAVGSGAAAWCSPDEGSVMKAVFDPEAVARPSEAVGSATTNSPESCADFNVKLDMPEDFERGASPSIPGRHIDMFRAKDGAQLLVEHGCLGANETLDTLWERALNENKNVSFKKKGPAWFVVSGLTNQHIFYKKVVVTGRRWATFNIHFAESLRSTYDPLLAGMERSLRIVNGAP